MATYRNIRKVLNLPTLSASPSSGANGEMYFNTGDLALYIYDGAWKKVTQSTIDILWWQGSSTAYAINGLSGGTSNTKNIESISLSSDGNGTAIGLHASTGFQNAVCDSESSTSKLWYGSLNYATSGALENSFYYSMTSGGTTISSGGSLNGTLAENAFGRGSIDKLFILGRGSRDNSDATQVQTVSYASASTATLSSYVCSVPGTDGSHNSSARGYGATGVSTTDLYTFGGLMGQYGPPAAGTTAYANQRKIGKFSMANNANASLQTGLCKAIYSQPSAACSDTKIFMSGGYDDSVSGDRLTDVDAYVYASDTDMTEHGDLYSGGGARSASGQGTGSSTHGYSAGGYQAGGGLSSGWSSDILKFSFTTTGVCSNIGDLPTIGLLAATGQH